MILDRIASRHADLPGRWASAHGVSWRRFLQAGAVAGGGLIVSLSLPLVHGEAEVADADVFAPNAFIRIGSDGQIVLTMRYVEMGQGTYTAISILITEELEVDLKQTARGTAAPNNTLFKCIHKNVSAASANFDAIRK